MPFPCYDSVEPSTDVKFGSCENSKIMAVLTQSIMSLRSSNPTKMVDASFIKDDEHTRKVGKLQEIIYYLDEKNFKDSVEKITGLGFASDLYVADLARNIIHLSVFYKSKRPLLIRLVSEFKSKSDIVNQIELHIGYGIKVEAQPFLLSLIDSNFVSNFSSSNHRVQENIEENLEQLFYSEKQKKLKKWDKHLQKMIEEDDVEELKQVFVSPDFDINQMHYFKVLSLLYFGLIKFTLIEFAAFCGSISCFRFLYINGASIKRLPGQFISHLDHRYHHHNVEIPQGNSDEMLLMDLAIAGGNIEIMKILEQSKIQPDPYCITLAIEFHRIEIYDWIYDQFSEYVPQICDPCIYLDNEFIHGIHCIKKVDPQLAFDASCKSRIISIVKLLLSNFSLHVSKNFIDACSYGCIEVLKLIFSLPSFDINSINITRMPPLSIACRKGEAEVVKFLLSTPSIDVSIGVFSYYLMNIRFASHVKKVT